MTATRTRSRTSKTQSQRGHIPPRRGVAVGTRPSAPRSTGWIFVVALLLGLAALVAGDLLYSPSLLAHRNRLGKNVLEFGERIEEMRAERKRLTADRDRFAVEGVLPQSDDARRWDGMPYRSTEHLVFDYDRRLAEMEIEQRRLLAEALEWTNELDRIDRQKGKRLPYIVQAFEAIQGRNP